MSICESSLGAAGRSGGGHAGRKPGAEHAAAVAQRAGNAGANGTCGARGEGCPFVIGTHVLYIQISHPHTCHLVLCFFWRANLANLGFEYPMCRIRSPFFDSKPRTDLRHSQVNDAYCEVSFCSHGGIRASGTSKLRRCG